MNVTDSSDRHLVAAGRGAVREIEYLGEYGDIVADPEEQDAIAAAVNSSAWVAGITMESDQATPEDWPAGPLDAVYVQHRARVWVGEAELEIDANVELAERVRLILDDANVQLNPSSRTAVEEWLDRTVRWNLATLRLRIARLEGLDEHLGPLVDPRANNIKLVAILARITWHNLYSTQVLTQMTRLKVDRLATEALIHDHLQDRSEMILDRREEIRALIDAIPDETLADAETTRAECDTVMEQVYELQDAIMAGA